MIVTITNYYPLYWMIKSKKSRISISCSSSKFYMIQYFHNYSMMVLSSDFTDDCVTTGGHYNPDGVDHGAPGGPASSRHVGDFGNVISFYG